MEPAESFNMDLRGYQKQALQFVLSLSTPYTFVTCEPAGCCLLRPDLRMRVRHHPCIPYGASELVLGPIFLFSLVVRYAFPQEPVFDGDMIDLTADEKLFYFNPYSGELSLSFPKAERNCEGGILAYVGIHFGVTCSETVFVVTVIYCHFL